MEIALYALVFFILLVCELVYFRLADKFNIIDKPNERSSHTTVTLRGGGIIFPFSAFLYFTFTGNYLWIILGLLAIAVISFIDDIKPLSGKVRILVHLLSVSLLFYEINLFSFSWFLIVIGYVLVIGIINAYNFMDGINGITGVYSLSVLIPLFIINSQYNFIDADFIIYTALGVLVFLLFNFRKKAKCFAGDIGSVSIAFILLFLLAKLIINTGDFKYILFLAVYGVDSVLTIAHRLLLKENIFVAHRKHLYQYLSNEVKLPHLLVSVIYATIQVLISLWLVYSSSSVHWWSVAVVLVFLGVLYIIIKRLILMGKIKPVA